ncbi:hypothetical protein GCM10011584_35400 [Nocardioides phosphati]|uniref:Barstar (barnase inhibitor) domain-containing protein n=1 Tax=Nocardioides phosphati TaxID=1867775 RepID=A0ABQ2NFS8_9ACTN|nr:barstar family protein [Nocardioides phosphati]GGO94423.1 hypothetical protein GCM10011584_35400 [Nocardioides phosphati]
MADVEINGAGIRQELDVHKALAGKLEFGPYYGWNLAALRDRLLTDVPRPVHITWRESALSRRALGPEIFGRIVAIFEEAAEQDVSFGWTERFEFELR